METTVIDLPCRLTDDEKLVKSETMAHVHDQIVALELKKKTDAAAVTCLINASKGELARLATEINTGEELRPVRCHERPRYGAMMVDVIRDDTGKTVSSRAMKEEERQTSLELVHGGPAMPRTRGDDAADSDGEYH